MSSSSSPATSAAATATGGGAQQFLLTHLRGFTVGAVAACGAVTFTNPWEVVKTRLQLQGELESRMASTLPQNRQYTSAVSAFIKICRAEGIRGIQRGLAPAYAYQVLLNGTRLGLYEPLRDAIRFGVDRIGGGRGQPWANPIAMVSSGALSGVLGAMLASPLYLVKTRMQSYSPRNAVGHQHSYVTRGTLFSLATIHRNEGLKGLWRGVDAAMIRTGVGSAVQLSSYETNKKFLERSGWFDGGGVRLHFAASALTSLLVCVAMNPFDVVSTRMYNQHAGADGKRGSLYTSAFDCMVKSFRTEGLGAFYKGFLAHYIRIGPHTILTFVFLEQAKKTASYLLD